MSIVTMQQTTAPGPTAIPRPGSGPRPHSRSSCGRPALAPRRAARRSSATIVRANAILRPPITTVTVKAGDTLSEIAAAHQLTLNATAVVLGLISRSQVSPTS